MSVAPVVKMFADPPVEIQAVVQKPNEIKHFSDLTAGDILNDIRTRVMQEVPTGFGNNVSLTFFLGGTDNYSTKLIEHVTSNYKRILADVFSRDSFPIIINGATEAGHIKILVDLLNKETRPFLSVGFTTANYTKYDTADRPTLLAPNKLTFLFGSKDDSTNGYGIETPYMFGAFASLIQKYQTTMSFVNGGAITAKEFFFAAAHASTTDKTTFYIHENTGRFSDGLIKSIGSDKIKFFNKLEDVTAKEYPYSLVEKQEEGAVENTFMLTCLKNEYDDLKVDLNVGKLIKISKFPMNGGRGAQPKVTKTTQKTLIGNRMHVVYEGRRGGKYVKQKGQYVLLKKH